MKHLYMFLYRIVFFLLAKAIQPGTSEFEVEGVRYVDRTRCRIEDKHIVVQFVVRKVLP